MRTRSTSIEAPWRAALSAILLLFVAGCDNEPTPVPVQECRANQFRQCDHECGRGVEQCVEPGVWSACACTVLDGGLTTDARPDRNPVDASDAGDASDASDATDAADDRATDAPTDATDAPEPDDAGDSASDAPSE